MVVSVVERASATSRCVRSLEQQEAHLALGWRQAAARELTIDGLPQAFQRVACLLTKAIGIPACGFEVHT
jgi:hypothetical protein